MLRERLGFRGFRAALEVEAARGGERGRARSGPRRDLTALPTFTVDPATARDFDDAVSAQREGDGARVWIHIADVAAHVRPGSPLDIEALRRANSTYVPGTVEPMLPHALSSGACSLSPGVERLAVTAEIELDPAASRADPLLPQPHPLRRAPRLRPARPRSSTAARSRPRRSPNRSPRPATSPRRWASTAAPPASTSNRPSRSSSSTPKGNVVAAHRVAQTEAHRLIERLMILTNEQVASSCVDRRVPAVYRVHAQPDPPRIERLLEQLAALDVPTPPLGQGLSPRSAGEMAAAASRLARREAARRGHGRGRLHLAGAPLAQTGRLQRAKHRPRRARQRRLHPLHLADPALSRPAGAPGAAGGAGRGGGGADAWREAREVAAHCSAQERESAKIERDADDVCAAYLLERELGERGLDAEFDGEVSGVIRAGAFVAFGGELGDVYEGMLPARSLPGGRYELDRAEVPLIGSGEGRGRCGSATRCGCGRRGRRRRGRVDLS